MYVIDEIGNNQIKIQENTFNDDDFAEYFVVAFAYTNHKIQGITIKDAFNIYEWNKMVIRAAQSRSAARGHRSRLLHRLRLAVARNVHEATARRADVVEGGRRPGGGGRRLRLRDEQRRQPVAILHLPRRFAKRSALSDLKHDAYRRTGDDPL